MKIAELTAFHVRIPLRKPIRHASHRRTETDNLLVRCVLEDRTEGYGEGVPREYVTGETIDSALALLNRSDLAAQRARCTDFAPPSPSPNDCAWPRCRRRPRLRRKRRPMCGRTGRPRRLRPALRRRAADVTRLLAPDLYAPRPKVQYSGAITSAKGLKLRLAAWAMRLYGFRQLKVKVGIAGHDDVRPARSIRKRVGAGMDLRIDANEAWPAAEAAERILALEPFGISSVEQPSPHAEWRRWPRCAAGAYADDAG